MNGDAGYYDTQADTLTIDYMYTLNDLQTEMRLWEPASVIYWQFYGDFDYQIETLVENTFVLEGNSKPVFNPVNGSSSEPSIPSFDSFQHVSTRSSLLAFS